MDDVLITPPPSSSSSLLNSKISRSRMVFMSLGIHMIYLFHTLLQTYKDERVVTTSVDNNNNVNNSDNDDNVIFRNNSHFKWLIR